jgi:D-alanyl-D-alanine carboxypeptidase (penicillin-binding protein 5/6)
MKRKIIISIALFILITSSLIVSPVKAQPEISSKSAILIDASTGEVLFEKNPDAILPPASITKVMTLILAGEALEDGNIKIDEITTVSQNAKRIGGSQVYLEVGEKISVADLIKSVAIYSANDAAVALAEHISGTEAKFVDLMNKRAKEIGMDNTTFKNPTGLSVDGHVSTARDIALMSMEILKYPKVYQYLTIWEDWLRKDDLRRKFWLTNRNRLLKLYPDADGIKTGFTSDALHCLTATAKRGDFRVISVVLGANSSDIRYQESARLLDYGFNNFSSKELIKKGQIILENQWVSKGSVERVNIVAGGGISLLFRKGEDYEPQIEIKVNDLAAPLSVEVPVGEIVLKHNGERVGSSKLYPSENVAKGTIRNSFRRVINRWTALFYKK